MDGWIGPKNSLFLSLTVPSHGPQLTCLHSDPFQPCQSSLLFDVMVTGSPTGWIISTYLFIIVKKICRSSSCISERTVSMGESVGSPCNLLELWCSVHRETAPALFSRASHPDGTTCWDLGPLPIWSSFTSLATAISAFSISFSSFNYYWPPFGPTIS